MAAQIVSCPNCGTRNRVPAASKGTPQCAQCHTPLPWIANADDESFDAAIDAKVPVLVDLWAPWCGPCRSVSPILERLAGEKAGTMKLVKVNVDNSPATQARFAVQAIPTLLVMRNGREVARQRGASGYPQLKSWLESSLRG